MSKAQQTEKRRFRIVGISDDGERFVFADGLDIVEAYSSRRQLIEEPGLPRIVVEIERPSASEGEP